MTFRDSVAENYSVKDGAMRMHARHGTEGKAIGDSLLPLRLRAWVRSARKAFRILIEDKKTGGGLALSSITFAKEFRYRPGIKR